jgi:hypothetical protein
VLEIDKKNESDFLLWSEVRWPAKRSFIVIGARAVCLAPTVLNERIMKRLCFGMGWQPESKAASTLRDQKPLLRTHHTIPIAFHVQRKKRTTATHLYVSEMIGRGAQIDSKLNMHFDRFGEIFKMWQKIHAQLKTDEIFQFGCHKNITKNIFLFLS